jgi:hypothetical protein
MAPAQLVGRGRYKSFALVRQEDRGKRVAVAFGRRLAGLTKKLEQHIFSAGTLPRNGLRDGATDFIGPHRKEPKSWTGKRGGFRRGTAIDKQLTSIANGNKIPVERCYRLSRIALRFLEKLGLTLVCGQLPVASSVCGLGSAIDLVCVHRPTARLYIIEIKTGYQNDRRQPASIGGVPQRMRAPVARAVDSLRNRHLAQLATTVSLFLRGEGVHTLLSNLGIMKINSLLIYLTNNDVEVCELHEWWMQKGGLILDACGSSGIS